MLHEKKKNNSKASLLQNYKQWFYTDAQFSIAVALRVRLYNNEV